VLRGVLVAPVALGLLLVGAHLALRAWPDLARAAINAGYLSLSRDSYPLTTGDVYRGLLWATEVWANRREAAALLGLLAIGAMLLVWQTGRWSRVRAWRGWPALLLAVSALDLLAFAVNIHPRSPLTRIAEEHPSALAVSSLVADDGEPVRVLASPVLVQVSPNRLAPLGLQEANGYSSLESRWHQGFAQRVLRVDDDLLDLWNVRYVLEPARYGTLSSYQGVTFLAGNPLLDGPADNSVGDQTFGLAPDSTVSEVRVVSALVNGVEIPQGTPVAELLLHGSGGEVVANATLEAGRDVMDWAWNAPNVQPKVQHAQVETAGKAREFGNGMWQDRALSYSRVTLDQPVVASALEVRSITPHGTFVLYGGAAVGPSGESQLFGRRKTKYREVYRDRDVAVFEDTAAFPRAFLVAGARLAASPGAALDQLVSQSFDPRREVLLAGDTPPTLVSPADAGAAASQDSAPAESAPGRVRVDRYTPEAIDLSTSAAADSYLVLTDSYYPGWHAYVDGQERPVMRGDVLFRVVRVPSGAHQVTFRFEPVSPKLGLAITLSALALVLAGLAFGVWPRQRGQENAPLH
jgi:hypothetical protein